MNQFPLLFSSVILIMSANGQSPFFQEYNLLNRNEVVDIKSIYQGKTGYVWIGTDHGLFRFDGLNKTRFTTQQGLPSNVVTAIAQDSLGRIWTGHENGVIAYQEGDRFIKFNPPEGSATAQVSKIHFDKNGILWYSTLNDGIYYYSKDRLYRLDETDGMPDIFVYDFVEDKQGLIYAATDLGLAIIDLKNQKVSIKTISALDGLLDNIVTSVLVHSDTVWLATQDKGLFYLSGDGKPVALSPDWNSGSIKDFILVNNKIWFTNDEGLHILDIKEDTSIKNVSKNWNRVNCNKLLQDREGNIWIGNAQTLIRSFGDYIQFINTQQECGVDNVVSLVYDKDNNLWFSGSTGLYKRVPNGSVKRQLSKSKFEDYPFISLYVDSENNVWAGSYGMGVVKIDQATGRLTEIRNELGNGNILSIRGIKDEIWLATLGGASRLTKSNGIWEVQNFDRSNGLLSDYNYQVFIDSKKRKWFATDGKGALLLDQGKFTAIQDSAHTKVFFGFDEDIYGNIWANIQNEGLFQIDETSIKSAIKFTPNESIGAFACDGYGSLAAFQNAGLDLINSKTGEVRHFGEEFGIRDMKPNLNAITKDTNGNIYFGTSNGIVVFSTNVNRYPQRPVARIEYLLNSNKMVQLDKPLDFSHNQNDLIINYTAFWYQNPTELSFSYQLENFDDNWIMTRDRYVTYSNLPPGEYKFKLKVSSNSDFQFSDEVVIALVINPPFWKRIWFYVLVAVLILYGTYLFIRYRERSLVEENRILEMKVRERYAEILKKNEEIMAQAEEIKSINDNLEKIVKERTEQLELKNKALEEAAFFNSHKLRAPVASLLGLTNLIKRLQLAQEDREYLDHFETSCQKLDDVVRSITTAIDEAELKDPNAVKHI